MDATTITEDASTPAVVTQTSGATSALASGSFTPPGGSLVLVLWSGNSTDPTVPTDPSINAVTGLTWRGLTVNKRGVGSPVSSVDGQSMIWWAKVPYGGIGSISVTVNNNAASGTRHAALAVRVANGTADWPIGANGIGSDNANGTITVALTAQGDYSCVYAIHDDWSASGNPTANAGTTKIAGGNIGAPDVSYGVWRRTTNDTVGGKSVTGPSWNSATGAAADFKWSYIEILALEDNVARPQRGPGRLAPSGRWAQPYGDTTVSAGTPATNAPAADAAASVAGQDANTALGVNATDAAAASAGLDATAALGASATDAAAAAAGQNATVAVQANATDAAVTVTGQDATAALQVNAADAAATAAAFDATVSTASATNAPAADAAVTATGQDAAPALGVNALDAAVTAAGQNASGSASVNAGQAAAGADGQNPAAAIGVNATDAAATAAAFDATVSTSAATNAPAADAAVAAAGFDASAAVSINVADAAVAAAAFGPTVATGVNGTTAAAAAAAFDATVAISVFADAALVDASGQGAQAGAGTRRATSVPAVFAGRTSTSAVAGNRTSGRTVTGRRTSSSGVSGIRTSTTAAADRRTSTPEVEG